MKIFEVSSENADFEESNKRLFIGLLGFRRDVFLGIVFPLGVLISWYLRQLPKPV